MAGPIYALPGAGGGGGIGGTTGSADNAILRADGTGGATAQGSGATLDDSDRLDVQRIVVTTSGYATLADIGFNRAYFTTLYGGDQSFFFNPINGQFPSDYYFKWTADTTNYTTADVSLARVGVGVLAARNGDNTGYAALKANAFYVGSYAIQAGTLGLEATGSRFNIPSLYFTNGVGFDAASGGFSVGVSFNGTKFFVAGAFGANPAGVGGAIFTSSSTVSTTSTNGTEDDLYSYTVGASQLSENNQKIEQIEHVSFVSSATAARRIKKYFGGTLIFDSGSLTLSLGGEFTIFTFIVRESSSVVRCDVSVTSTSASSIPYSTYTRITGLTLTNTNILKTTGIASGTGAASADISNVSSGVSWTPNSI